jgi:non-heme chloroperoxidase
VKDEANTIAVPKLAFRETGEGKPLLFVHGWAMSGPVWKYQVDHFSASRKCVAVDLPGHGGSPLPSRFSLAETGEAVAAQARSVGPETVLIGWSMGSMAALRAASLLRNELAGVVLVGGTPKFASSSDWPHGLDPSEVRGMDLRLRRDYVGTMEAFFRGMFPEGEVTPEEYRRIARDAVERGSLPEPAAARSALAALVEEDLRGILQEIQSPVLLLHGSADTVCLPSASAWMAERLPHARLEILEGLGHAPFLSRPDLFNRLLKNYLETLP